MPSKSVNVIVRVCEACKQEGYEVDVPLNVMKRKIGVVAGAEVRAIVRYLQLMKEWGVVREETPGVLRIEWNEVYKLDRV